MFFGVNGVVSVFFLGAMSVLSVFVCYECCKCFQVSWMCCGSGQRNSKGHVRGVVKAFG